MLELKLSHSSTNTGVKTMEKNSPEKIIYNLQGQIQSLADLIIALALKTDPDVLKGHLKRIEECKKSVSDENRDAYVRGYSVIERPIVVSLTSLECSEKTSQESDSGLH